MSKNKEFAELDKEIKKMERSVKKMTKKDKSLKKLFKESDRLQKIKLTPEEECLGGDGVLLNTEESQWNNGYRTFAGARKRLDAAQKNHFLRWVVYLFGLLTLIGCICAALFGKNLFLCSAIPLGVFCFVIMVMGKRNVSPLGCVGYMALGFFVSGFFVGCLFQLIIKLDEDVLLRIAYPIIVLLISAGAFFWALKACIINRSIFSLSRYKKAKRDLLVVKKKSIGYTEDKYDAYILGMVEQHNNAIIAEIRYKEGFAAVTAKERMEKWSESARLGNESAKAVLEQYYKLEALFNAETTDYDALFGLVKDVKLGLFAKEHLRNIPVDVSYDESLLFRLRDEVGSFYAKKALIAIGDAEYKECKASAKKGKMSDAVIDKCIEKGSVLAKVERGLLLYKKAISGQNTEVEKDKILRSIVDLFKAGLDYEDKAYNVCANIMYRRLKYTLWTPFYSEGDDILGALKKDLDVVRKSQEESMSKSLFKRFGLAMDEVCNKLIDDYVETINARESLSSRSSSVISSFDEYLIKQLFEKPSLEEEARRKKADDDFYDYIAYKMMQQSDLPSD